MCSITIALPRDAYFSCLRELNGKTGSFIGFLWFLFGCETSLSFFIDNFSLIMHDEASQSISSENLFTCDYFSIKNSDS